MPGKRSFPIPFICCGQSSAQTACLPLLCCGGGAAAAAAAAAESALLLSEAVRADLGAITAPFPGLVLAAAVHGSGEVACVLGRQSRALAEPPGVGDAAAAAGSLVAVSPQAAARPPPPQHHSDPAAAADARRVLPSVPPLLRSVVAHCAAGLGTGRIRCPALHVKGSRSIVSVFTHATTTAVIVAEPSTAAASSSGAGAAASALDTAALDAIVLPLLPRLHADVDALMRALEGGGAA